jgi:hypothetical protein
LKEKLSDLMDFTLIPVIQFLALFQLTSIVEKSYGVICHLAVHVFRPSPKILCFMFNLKNRASRAPSKAKLIPVICLSPSRD